MKKFLFIILPCFFLLLTSCQSPSQVEYIEYDEAGADTETSETKLEKYNQDAMITFEYDLGNGNTIPISFRLLDIIIVIIVVVIVIAIPIIILWRKAKKLGIDDMSFDQSFTPTTSSDKPAKPLLEKPVRDQSEVPFLDPRFLQRNDPNPINNPETVVQQSKTSSVSEAPKSRVTVSEKTVQQTVSSQSMSAPPPLPSTSIASESYLEGIETLKQLSVITEKLSDIPLSLQPNACLFRDAMRREILVLPRFETAEAMNHFLQQYHEVYIVIDKNNITKCQKLD